MLNIRPLLIGLIILLFQNTFVSAKEVVPVRNQIIPTAGPVTFKKSGQIYEKSSQITEYQFDDVQGVTQNNPGDLLVLNLDHLAVGFSIVIYTEAKDFAYVYDLTAPDGTPIITKSPKDVPQNLLSRADINGRGQMVSLNATQPETFKELSITQVPNNDRVKIQPGRWKFKIAQESLEPSLQPKFKVSVFVKSSNLLSDESRGLISLNLHVSQDSGLSLNIKELNSLLKPVQEIYKKVGLELSIKSVSQVSDKYKQSCDNPEFPCFQKLMDFFKDNQKNISSSGILNAFVLKRNNYSNAGISNLGGSVSSFFQNPKNKFESIVVWRDPLASNDFSIILGHELSHHLGLYHTDIDFVTDTKDFDHWIFGNEAPKDRNLMEVNYSGKSSLTEGQKYVLMRSVAVDLYQPVKSKK